MKSIDPIESRFWVRPTNVARWHVADRRQVRRKTDNGIVIFYVLRCSDKHYEYRDLDEIERTLPDEVKGYDICGHNPCVRTKRKR